MKISSHALRVIVASAGMCLAASGANAQQITLGEGLGTGGEPALTFDPSTPGSAAVPATCTVNTTTVPFGGSKADCEAVSGVYAPSQDAVPPTPAKATVNANVNVNGDLETTGSVVAGAVFADGRNVGVALQGHDDHLINHEGRITAAEGNIVTIKTDLGALQGTVGEHGVILNDHGQRIGTLETTVDGHQVVLDDHGQRIGTLEGVAVNHEGRITAAEGKNTQQDGRLDGHDTRIKATEDKNTQQDKTLASHDGRITKAQGQADATDNRLNKYNGTGNTIEHWSSGVDMWREEAAYAISNHGSRLNALEDWRNIAEGQIASLQGDVKRLQKTIAVATAITIPHVDHGKRFALTVSGAGVDGEGAGAIAAALRFNDTAQGFVGAGTSFSGGATAVKGGVTFQW